MEGECKKTMFQSIKQFFSKIFNKQKMLKEGENETNRVAAEKDIGNSTETFAKQEVRAEKTTPSFLEEHQKNRKYEILKQQFDQRKIEEEDIPEEDREVLRQMYFDEIDDLKQKKYNLMMKKISQDKETMAVYEKFEKREINEEDMTDEQRSKLRLIYELQIENYNDRIESAKRKQAV